MAKKVIFPALADANDPKNCAICRLKNRKHDANHCAHCSQMADKEAKDA